MNTSSKDKILFRDNVENSNVNYWELHNNSNFWSSTFIQNLGYQPEDIDQKLDFFLNTLIHKNNRDLFRDNFYGLVRNDTHFKQTISIKSKDGTYKEFICKTNEELPVNIKADSKIIFFFEKKLQKPEKLKDDNFYYRETAEMTSTGSWYVDFMKQKSYWDYETRKILEYPEDYIPSVKESYKYYTKDQRQLAADLFFRCAMSGESFDTEIKMITANDRIFWVRAIGKPVYNDEKEIIGIRGVFQDIDEAKQKELKLQKTSDIVASQNTRLFNFAHIVSHNLRSHTSNLQLISQLLETTKDPDEKLELINSVKDVSDSLSQTIDHLNEIVTIQTKIDQTRESIKFNNVLSLIKSSISHLIMTSKASVISDFTKAESITYIPAYLESIVLNLMTNAIKYKHPDRDPIITLKTYRQKEDSKIVLEVSDNGLGIDLEAFGEKIFGMYKTFHYNDDAMGIGLFITKNQIESLNGEISVESEVGKGSTFKIVF